MAVSRSMWLRGIEIDCAQMRRNARDDFVEATKEISRKWKDGFASLKAENDSLQLAAKSALQTELNRIAQDEKQWKAQGPPKD